ncbi:hypothetical protein [Radiobacillus deserti]|uniref:Uncharacterized protein n=1 Tax=Radiobacillus deserti TaxID=2594883 RepID=A0A516KKT5_9BACI|nr:hypothetical protein [Radiobacillus deserti]QDP41988.1 hypothetical protein FN924_18525 [Radiobacillus deserti]
MDFWFDLEYSIPHISMYLLEFALVAFLFIRIYKKRKEATKIWVAILAVIVGLFVLSIDIPVQDVIIRLPILPLGAWILYFLWRRSNRWETYRTFTWLGFLTSFISIAVMLGASFLHDLIYPKDSVSTYLANIESSKVIRLVDEAPPVTLQTSTLQKMLASLEMKEVDSITWYHKSTEGQQELFPYQLMQAQPRFGSNIETVIYVHKDGNGLLIQTEDHQYYFHSDQSFLEKGGDKR